MGSRASAPIVPTKEVETKITSNLKEYENIKIHFQKLSKTFDLATGYIKKDIFINVYLKKLFSSFGNDLLERLFTVLAFKGKEYIIFEEFLQTKYLLQHIPSEPQIQIAKLADDFYTEDEILYEHRLKLIFNLFDLDFNGYISRKEFEKILPTLMQNDNYRLMDIEEMKEYNEWFSEISSFVLIHFDRSRMGRLSWRDFRNLSRYDLTIQNIMDCISPGEKKKDDYECLKFAQLIQKKYDQRYKPKKKISKIINPTKTFSATVISPFKDAYYKSFHEIALLEINDKIDVRDKVGRFLTSTIIEKQENNNKTLLKIHHDGWSDKWDTWIDYKKELYRLARAGSISKRAANRFTMLKKSDFVDINPIHKTPGWKVGEIRKIDNDSGQIQVVYMYGNKNYLYWTHLDNDKEIAAFTTKSGTVNTVQKNIQTQIKSTTTTTSTNKNDDNK